MVDAEQHRTHRRYPLGVPDLDALEEKPDPEPRDHPHDGVEGVHYSLVLRPGDTSPSRALRAAANGRFLSRRSDAIATPRRPASPLAPGGLRDRANALPGAHRP